MSGRVPSRCRTGHEPLVDSALDPLRTCPFVLAQENTDLIRGMNLTFDHAVITRHAAR